MWSFKCLFWDADFQVFIKLFRQLRLFWVESLGSIFGMITTPTAVSATQAEFTWSWPGSSGGFGVGFQQMTRTPASATDDPEAWQWTCHPGAEFSFGRCPVGYLIGCGNVWSESPLDTRTFVCKVIPSLSAASDKSLIRKGKNEKLEDIRRDAWRIQREAKHFTRSLQRTHRLCIGPCAVEAVERVPLYGGGKGLLTVGTLAGWLMVWAWRVRNRSNARCRKQIYRQVKQHPVDNDFKKTCLLNTKRKIGREGIIFQRIELFFWRKTSNSKKMFSFFFFFALLPQDVGSGIRSKVQTMKSLKLWRWEKPDDVSTWVKLWEGKAGAKAFGST